MRLYESWILIISGFFFHLSHFIFSIFSERFSRYLLTLTETDARTKYVLAFFVCTVDSLGCSLALSLYTIKCASNKTLVGFISQFFSHHSSFLTSPFISLFWKHHLLSGGALLSHVGEHETKQKTVWIPFTLSHVLYFLGVSLKGSLPALLLVYSLSHFAFQISLFHIHICWLL